MSGVPDFLTGPVLLSADNFTPCSRTPWAGAVIGERFKRGALPQAAGTRIGEAWDYSCDAAFPSRIVGGAAAGRTLASVLDEHEAAAVSPARIGHGAELLIKLLNASQPLS